MNKTMTKYEKIKQDIIHKINIKALLPNQVIPSQNQLCEEYAVSRVTVRKAIDDLVSEGYLYKKQGKGSFVKANFNPEGLPQFYGYSKAIMQQGKTPTKILLSQSMEKATKEIASKLQITTDDDVVILEVLYLSDGIPLCVNKSIISYKLFPKLEFFNFNNNSLYDILKSVYKLNLTRVTQLLDAVISPKQINKHLHVSTKQPLLRIDATAYCMYENEEIPFEIYESYLSTETLNYFIESTS